MSDHILHDAFLSFARFPDHAGVMKIFNRGESSFPGYATLKTAAQNMAEKNLVPGIKDFVFASNEERARKVIDGFSDFYLLIDYGQIDGAKDRFEIETNSFYIAATVARPISTEETDMAEEIVIPDMALNYLRQIRNYFKLADREKLLKDLEFPLQAIPFIAPELNNSTGWTMIMTKRGVGML
jgi:hypothetical protein